MKRKKKFKNFMSMSDFKSTYIKIILPCSKCKKPQEVFEGVKEVICPRCACILTGPPPILKPMSMEKKIVHPRGWKFMKEYVDKEGNVYIKGVLQPQLKNKRPITDIENLKKIQKEKRAERKKKKQTKLLEHAKKAKKEKKAKKAKELNDLQKQNRGIQG